VRSATAPSPYDRFSWLTCFVRVTAEGAARFGATDGPAVSCETRANESFASANVSIAGVTGADDWQQVTWVAGAIDSRERAIDGVTLANESIAGGTDSMARVTDGLEARPGA
jgi:hypothetical protein